MGKIREDLEGVVYVDGQALQAGDDIPDGVELGDHLTGKPEPKQSAKADEPAKPAAK